ncbi:MAG: TIGR04283 family arsenosugar biosynthesis glycosyltransferase [Bacteroidota bacterium]
MLITIVIPTLNEAACIRRTLSELQSLTPPFELIVVDGGSVDDTAAIAHPFARVVQADRGRAVQMNAGAAVASGDVLLFLHADTVLPANALDLIRGAAENNISAGNFRLKFDASSPLLGLYSFFTRFRVSQFSFGDRGLFVTKTHFEETGGFAPIPIFEDLDLARRLQKNGPFAYLDAYATTSARRFRQHGALRQQLRNAYLWTRYLLGTSPKQLAHLYPYASRKTT